MARATMETLTGEPAIASRCALARLCRVELSTCSHHPQGDPVITPADLTDEMVRHQRPRWGVA